MGGDDEELGKKFKRMIYITDSMTAYELNSDGMCFFDMNDSKEPVGLGWRALRVAKGSGTSMREVEDMMFQYRMMANMAKQAGGKNGWYDILVSLHGVRMMTNVVQVAGNAEDADCSGRSWEGSQWHADTITNTGHAESLAARYAAEVTIRRFGWHARDDEVDDAWWGDARHG